jgi:predicted secreted Zn-dependent protease
MTDHGSLILSTTTGAVAAKCTGLCSLMLLASSILISAMPWLQAFALVASGIAGVISIILGVRSLRDKGPRVGVTTEVKTTQTTVTDNKAQVRNGDNS